MVLRDWVSDHLMVGKAIMSETELLKLKLGEQSYDLQKKNQMVVICHFPIGHYQSENRYKLNLLL